MPPIASSVRNKRRRTREDTNAPEAVKIAVGLLEDEFDLRQTASESFPHLLAYLYIY
jgi:hypothetical protein